MTNNLSLCRIDRRSMMVSGRPRAATESLKVIRKNKTSQQNLAQQLEVIDKAMIKLSLEMKQITTVRHKFQQNKQVYNWADNIITKKSKDATVEVRRKQCNQEAQKFSRKRTQSCAGIKKVDMVKVFCKKSGKSFFRSRSQSLPAVSVPRIKARSTNCLSGIREEERDNSDCESFPEIRERRRGSLHNMELIQNMIQIRRKDNVHLETNATNFSHLRPKTRKNRTVIDNNQYLNSRRTSKL